MNSNVLNMSNNLVDHINLDDIDDIHIFGKNNIDDRIDDRIDYRIDDRIDDRMNTSEEIYITLNDITNTNTFEEGDYVLMPRDNKNILNNNFYSIHDGCVNTNSYNDMQEPTSGSIMKTSTANDNVILNQIHTNGLTFNSGVHIVNPLPLAVQDSQENYEDTSIVSKRSLLAKKLIRKTIDFNSMQFEDFEYSVYKQTIINKNNYQYTKNEIRYKTNNKYYRQATSKVIENSANNNQNLSILYSKPNVQNVDTHLEYGVLNETSQPNQPSDFNWKQYLANYPDLKEDGITTQEKAWSHWIRHGKKEGRTYFMLHTYDTNLCDELYNFDWKKYVNAYTDLQQDNITTKEKAWNHWICHGKKEGRIYFTLHAYDTNLCDELDNFDWKKYVNAYTDLQQDNITTKEKAWNHWIRHGKKEGRVFYILNEIEYDNFNWEQYLYNYQDLVDNGITTKESAWNHWYNYGKQEGRVCYNIYKTEELNDYTNFDLININNIHFKKKYNRYGIHYFGWKKVISSFIKWFKESKCQSYKINLFFDEWIEKMLIWGNKIINSEYLKQIKQNKYSMITFIHNPPFIHWNDATMREKLSKEMILTDNIHFNDNVFNIIYKNQYNQHISLLYTLSNSHKKYIYDNYPECRTKVVSSHHPIDLDTNENMLFDLDEFLKNRKIYNVGWWLRNFKTFIDFNPGPNFTKYILTKTDFIIPFNNIILKNNDLGDIQLVNELTNHEYARLFRNCCIFADIVECIANNTILECIKFNTPIILRRSPSAEEYLGINYPLFFDTIDDIHSLEEEVFLLHLIVQAHYYLKKMNKQHLMLNTFNRKIKYDIDKLSARTYNAKLTWCYFCEKGGLHHREQIIDWFISQNVTDKLELFVFINDYTDPITIDNMLEYSKKHNNITIIDLYTIEMPCNFSQKVKTLIPYIESPYVGVLDLNANISMPYNENYSQVFIDYLEVTLNCDIICSSANVINLNLDPVIQTILNNGSMLFIENLKDTTIENNGMIWRSDMLRLLFNTDFVELDDNDFVFYCITHNFNLFCFDY